MSCVHGRLHDRGVARGRMLADAAGEIAQVQAQLVERKAEREDVLDRVVRQFPCQTLAPQRSDFRGVAVERGFDLLERRRSLTR